MISMAPAQDRTAQIVRDPIVDTGHRAWLPNPRLFPTKAVSGRDLQNSLGPEGAKRFLARTPNAAGKKTTSCRVGQEAAPDTDFWCKHVGRLDALSDRPDRESTADLFSGNRLG